VVLNNTVTTDELALSFHTLETKEQSMHWVTKGQPGLVKARAKATRSKHMVLLFFTAKGVIYTNCVYRGKTVNTKDVKKALARFLVILRKEKPIM
jgi:hypothetical protein